MMSPRSKDFPLTLFEIIEIQNRAEKIADSKRKLKKILDLYASLYGSFNVTFVWMHPDCDLSAERRQQLEKECDAYQTKFNEIRELIQPLSKSALLGIESEVRRSSDYRLQSKQRKQNIEEKHLCEEKPILRPKGP